METIIVIILKNKYQKHEQNVLGIQFYICCTNFIRIGEQIRDVTWRGEKKTIEFIEKIKYN